MHFLRMLSAMYVLFYRPVLETKIFSPAKTEDIVKSSLTYLYPAVLLVGIVVFLVAVEVFHALCELAKVIILHDEGIYTKHVEI